MCVGTSHEIPTSCAPSAPNLTGPHRVTTGSQPLYMAPMEWPLQPALASSCSFLAYGMPAPYCAIHLGEQNGRWWVKHPHV